MPHCPCTFTFAFGCEFDANANAFVWAPALDWSLMRVHADCALDDHRAHMLAPMVPMIADAIASARASSALSESKH